MSVEKKKIENSNPVRIKANKNAKNIDNDTKNTNLLLLATFFTGILLIVSSYAWFSASLDVKIKFFDLSVSTNTGLFISLDGVDYSDAVEISVNSIITDLKSTYPGHTNQWAIGGLWPVSSNGIRTRNNDTFDIYIGEVSRRKQVETKKRFLNTKLIDEDTSSPLNSYIAFDIFLKNVSGSPKNDNLYFDEGTVVQYDESREMTEENKESMLNIMNSMRFGFIKIGSLPHNSPVSEVQNIKCNNNCEMVIYEPNSTSHSLKSIQDAKEYDINIVDGEYIPTYAVISEGRILDHTNGHGGVPVDTAHFMEQITTKDFKRRIFEIPNAITKLRVYVWIEGQDVDSLETFSDGAAIYLAINFIKDLAGYED